MILVIDNYDSFTYNLVQMFLQKGEVLVKRNDEVSPDEIERLAPSHIVISPGPGTPAESGVSREVIRRFAEKIPILGVCLGHQCIAEVFGARVERAERIMHGKTSMIEHDGKGVFAGVANPFEAMRYHSLIVREDTLPESLAVTARTADACEVMGIRHKTLAAIEGVQFHPESFMTEEGSKIITNFVAS